MKRQLKCILLLTTALFVGGCGADATQENNGGTDTQVTFQNPDTQAEATGDSGEETAAGTEEAENNSPVADPLLANREVLEEKMAALEVLDRTELTCYAEEETALRNSNLLNWGYLTYDGDGHIYFTDTNNGKGGIYVSDRNGENLEQLSEENALMMQVEGDWLYFHGEDGAIKRLHLETGEMQSVYDETYGEFIFAEGKLYINAEKGFCVTEPDGSNMEILKDSELTMACYVTGKGFWLGNVINGADGKWFFNGYLLGFDETQKKLCFIEEGAVYPLLAGNWLSVFDVNTQTRHIWNLETDEDIDLGAYAQRAVSDGNNLYCTVRNGGQYYSILKWDGTETTTLLDVEADNLEYLYLTPDALYYLPTVVADNKLVQQWWYYDLETGETGKIY